MKISVYEGNKEWTTGLEFSRVPCIGELIVMNGGYLEVKKVIHEPQEGMVFIKVKCAHKKMPGGDEDSLWEDKSNGEYWIQICSRCGKIDKTKKEDLIGTAANTTIIKITGIDGVNTI
jgi:hypothetical protein